MTKAFITLAILGIASTAIAVGTSDCHSQLSHSDPLYAPAEAFCQKLATELACVAQSGSSSKCSSGAANVFANSRLLTAANGAQLNIWSKQAVGQKWVNCYSSFTMDKKNPASFHDGCDQYNHTFTVVHTAGAGKGICSDCHPGPKVCTRSCSTDNTQCGTAFNGTGDPCGTVNLGGETFGGFADASWHAEKFNHPYQGTKDCFLYKLGPNPERFAPIESTCETYNSCKYMYADPKSYPRFGSSGDLAIQFGQVYNSSTHSCGGIQSYKNESCGGLCSGGGNEPTYSASPNQVCGGFKNWGETEMEVWRLAD